MRYEIILFDADETLFDFLRAQREAFFRTFNDHLVKNPTEEIFSEYHLTNESLWKALERGEITKETLVIERFRRLFASIGVEYDIARFNAGFLKRLGEGAYLLDGAKDVCRRIYESGRRIFIITNGIESTQRRRLAASEIKPYIDGIFISEAIGAAKPAREYFDYAAEHISNFSKEKSLVVGDSLTSDIAGANAAGIDCVWYNPSDKDKTGGGIPDYEITALEQLFDII